jgi:hypothetical protein
MGGLLVLGLKLLLLEPELLLCRLRVEGLVLLAVLWFRFRFQFVKSYGSGSDFRQVTVPVPVPYFDPKKQFFKKKLGKNLAFLHSKLFYKDEIDKFH